MPTWALAHGRAQQVFDILIIITILTHFGSASGTTPGTQELVFHEAIEMKLQSSPLAGTPCKALHLIFHS